MFEKLKSNTGVIISVSLIVVAVSSLVAFNYWRKHSQDSTNKTIFDRLDAWSTATLKIDGDTALQAAVDKFYSTVLVDPELKRFFEGHDHEKLRKHQFNFMKAAFSGGKFKYSDRSMEAAHLNLFKMGLGGKEFDLVAGHLVGALKALNVPSDIISDIVGVVGPLRTIFVDGAIKYGPKHSTILERLDTWSTATLKIGGDTALQAAVDQFYSTVLVDPELKRFFEGHDHEKLRKHQFNFMKAAFSGGKFKYTDKSMEVAHINLFKMGLGGKEFDLVAAHLVGALNTLNVPADITTDIVGVVGPLRCIFVDGGAKYGPKK